MGINAPSDEPAIVLATTWSAIHEAAATVGAIAGMDPASIAGEIRRGLAACPRSRLIAAVEDVHDLADIMRRGVSALLTAHTSGGSPQAAAGALWREFVATRDAMLTRDQGNADARQRA
jgi:hypothetical protein